MKEDLTLLWGDYQDRWMPIWDDSIRYLNPKGSLAWVQEPRGSYTMTYGTISNSTFQTSDIKWSSRP